jgi:hypothetical protein
MKAETRMSVAAMMAVLGISGFGNGGTRIVAKRIGRKGWSRPHQGAQEIARRRRQIELGQLTESNGLVKS